MNTAYTTANGVVVPPAIVNKGAGILDGLTLPGGLYKWGTGVTLGVQTAGASVTLSGGPNDVWIFQIAGDLTLGSGAQVMLSPGVQASNIFWVVSGSNFGATLGTGSTLYGTILSHFQVILNTGATLIGRALAQTQVTLASATVTSPGTLAGGLPPANFPTVTVKVPAASGVPVVPVPIPLAVTATFSEAMSTASLIQNPETTFTLAQTGPPVIPVAGVVTCAPGPPSTTCTTATFTPNLPLLPGVQYTATITGVGATPALDPDGVPLAIVAAGPAANVSWTFTTSEAAPTVSSVSPANGTVGVPLATALSATYSELMAHATINAATFTLKQGNTTIPGVFSFVDTPANTTIVTFQPNAPGLTCGLPYSASISAGAENLQLAGATPFAWSFTSAACGGGGGGGGGGAPPPVLPTVISTLPASGTASVAIASGLSATFSEAMNPTTITTGSFTLTGPGGTLVPGQVSYSGTSPTAVFIPTVNLAASATYAATITSAVTDLAGDHLASNYVWNFTTGTTVSTTHPSVISTTPVSGALGVPIGPSITATFSEAMDPLTINTATFTVTQGAFPETPVPVAGTVTYAGTTATFTPTSNLPVNTILTATITLGAEDLAGNDLLPGPYVWSFTTGTTGAQAPINLNSAVSFAVLAGSAVTNAGSTTVVTGNLGVSPGTSVTGFPPGTVSGTIYAGGAVAAQGQVDLTAAYNDAAGRSTGPITVAGDLGGQTLTPGLYKSTSSLAVVAGDLVLNAEGNANAVWIFQIASTLTTGAGRNVILTGGANAANVIWQVGSSATLGTNTTFMGDILANQFITVGNGVSMQGRLLAQVGVVSFLGTATITLPLPVISPGGIVNAASYARTVAAGSIVSVFGSNLAFGQGSASTVPLPTVLAGNSFQIGGEGVPIFGAPILSTSTSQVNLQIPWELAGQTQASAAAMVGTVLSNLQTMIIAAFAPGIFTLNEQGTGQGAILISGTAEFAAPVGTVPGSQPVNLGGFISIYCTGLGAVSNQPATGSAGLSSPLSVTNTAPVVTIGGVVAQVSYSGLAPGFVGLNQVNVQVPLGAPTGAAVPVILSIGGATSNTVTIAIAAQ